MHVFFPLETVNRSVIHVSDTRAFNNLNDRLALLNAKEWEKSMSQIHLFKQTEAKEKL